MLFVPFYKMYHVHFLAYYVRESFTYVQKERSNVEFLFVNTTFTNTLKKIQQKQWLAWTIIAAGNNTDNMANHPFSQYTYWFIFLCLVK